MTEPIKDVRNINKQFASGMYGTGFNLLLLALLFGGSAFFIQWGIWFVVVGWAASQVVAKGADAADWAYKKLPENPFRKSDNKN